MYKRSYKDICFDIINVIFMLFIVVICLYPFLYVVFASLSDSNLLMGHEGVLWWPLKPNLNSYAAVLKNAMVYTGYRNTLFVLVVGVAVNMLMTTLCAYVVSCKDFAMRNVAMGFILVTMFFGGGMVPFYLTVKDLGLENSLWALIIPSAINTYNMIIVRTAFASMPEALIESMKLDGASHRTILARLMLPLSMPTLAVIILYYAVSHWNAWFHAMIFLRERAKYPLQLILREILLQNNTDEMIIDISEGDRASVSETIQYAIIVVATVPILCIYPFVQKYFTKGVMIGAVKG